MNLKSILFTAGIAIAAVYLYKYIQTNLVTSLPAI